MFTYLIQILVLIGPGWGQIRTRLLEIKGIFRCASKVRVGEFKKNGYNGKNGGKKIMKDALQN
jgi:hypothetical protein